MGFEYRNSVSGFQTRSAFNSNGSGNTSMLVFAKGILGILICGSIFGIASCKEVYQLHLYSLLVSLELVVKS
jgi:hypothetical protein